MPNEGVQDNHSEVNVGQGEATEAAAGTSERKGI